MRADAFELDGCEYRVGDLVAVDWGVVKTPDGVTLMAWDPEPRARECRITRAVAHADLFLSGVDMSVSQCRVCSLVVEHNGRTYRPGDWVSLHDGRRGQIEKLFRLADRSELSVRLKGHPLAYALPAVKGPCHPGYENTPQRKDAPSPAAEGAKDDKGKLRMDLIPPIAIRDLLEEYEDGEGAPEYAIRHLVEWRAPEGSRASLVAAFSHGLAIAGNGVLFEGLREVARVLEYGASQAPRPDGTRGYGENNWQAVPDAIRRYYAAALRHGTAPGAHDPDSGLSHWAHFACCVAFLLHLTAE